MLWLVYGPHSAKKKRLCEKYDVTLYVFVMIVFISPKYSMY